MYKSVVIEAERWFFFPLSRLRILIYRGRKTYLSRWVCVCR